MSMLSFFFFLEIWMLFVPDIVLGASHTWYCLIPTGTSGVRELLLLFFCCCWVIPNLYFKPPWTVAHQTPLSLEFSRQEYWSGLPFPSPGECPDSGIKPKSPVLAGKLFTTEPPEKPIDIVITPIYRGQTSMQSHATSVRNEMVGWWVVSWGF